MKLRHGLVAFLVALALAGAASAAKAPDFTFKTDKGPLALESLRGKVVYLDYWASWCAPCRQSFPWMNEMQARYGDKGFVIVAVSIDTDPADAARFLAQHRARFIIAYDTQNVTAQAMRLKGMPTSFLIDRNGEIVSRHLGFSEADKAKLERNIKALLASGTTV